MMGVAGSCYTHGLSFGGGCVLNAMDGNSLSVTDAGALLLAATQALADLAEAGLADGGIVATETAVQRALNRLSAAGNCPLRLVIDGRTWEVGPAFDHEPHRICHRNARLEGVPRTALATVEQAWEAVLRAMAAQYRAGLVAASRQATAEKAESKIARRDQLLRRLFDLSPVGVVLIDYASGKITEANTAFMKFGSWSREALIGASIQAVLHADHEAVISRAVVELEEGGQFGPFEQDMTCPDGTCFPAIMRGLMLTAGGGQKIV